MLIQELTEEEIQPHPKEDCHPGGKVYAKTAKVNLKHFSTVVMRKTSVTLKQDLEIMEAFASNGVKVMVEKNF